MLLNLQAHTLTGKIQLYLKIQRKGTSQTITLFFTKKRKAAFLQ